MPQTLDQHKNCCISGRTCSLWTPLLTVITESCLATDFMFGSLPGTFAVKNGILQSVCKFPNNRIVSDGLEWDRSGTQDDQSATYQRYGQRGFKD